MRLDFSKLTRNQQKVGGTGGTSGTSPVYKAFSRPTPSETGGTRWDKLAESQDFVPPALKIVGQRKPAPVLVVPPVPPVPPQKQCSALRHQNDGVESKALSGDVDLIREFMEVDGLTLEEAQAMAAISIKPRSPNEWLVLIAELDQAIEAYCLAAGLPDDARVQLLAVRNRQSLASIPESMEWFRSIAKINLTKSRACRRHGS